MIEMGEYYNGITLPGVLVDLALADCILDVLQLLDDARDCSNIELRCHGDHDGNGVSVP